MTIIPSLLLINRQCIQAYMHTKERETWEQVELKKREWRENNPTKLWGIYERVSEVFSPNNRDILVVLLLLERGCNSHIT
jgi:hypothetical protein